jgi:putative hydrolase of the HAD superfamily
MTVDAVIFDWGGTLTPWRDIDGRQWQRIAARLVPAGEVDRVGTPDATIERRDDLVPRPQRWTTA